MNIVLCSRDEAENSLSHGLILCTEDEADFLMHYRTPNSKNGQRLYQYEDGSLTPLGRIHYGVGKGRDSKGKAEENRKKAEKLEYKSAKASAQASKAEKWNTILHLGRPKSNTLLSARAASKQAKADKLSYKAETLKRKADELDAISKEQEEKRRKRSPLRTH